MLPRSIRARLTLWYAVALAGSLLVFGAATYLYVRDNLFRQIETQLDKDLKLMAQTLDQPLHRFLELEAFGSLSLFMVEHDDWPIHVSNAWFNSDLGYVVEHVPFDRPWIRQSPARNFYHLKRTVVIHADQPYILTAAYAGDQIHAGLARLRIAMLLAIPFVVVAGLSGGYFMAGRFLAPIQYLTERARGIGAANLSERLAVRNPHDELGKLTAVLNAMLTRLEDSFHRLTRFTQDAAHELRTPLAVLRSVGEVGLQQPRDAEAYRDIIASMLEEAERMTRLGDGLLTLARAEAGRLPVQPRPRDVNEIIQGVLDCVQVLTEDKAQTLEFETIDDAVAHVDGDTLHLALMNLLTNAIRFTPAHGRIEIRVRKPAPEAMIIEVRDNGPGIAPAHQAHIFERFYRADRSRASATGGTGLGLAIAKWAVEVNGGRIELESREGEGSVFRVVFG